ncbi:glycosyltransferase family 1 protein [Occultella glacieicola]|uniref:Glycosyltransferase family 1 protein n=1 Tax=Occultella glacieicola TaxID=2518684 RepID=A0ABY2E4E7_9MICO|nr:glycosyltransferase family 4 protein [Occultella glacieicola]TDE94771.1 glycosyltransferase family 1 protein [Occultella glacieicola]
MTRVAYVTTDPGISVFGRKGASVHVRAVIRVLAAAGAEVHLITPRTDGEPPADLRGVTVHLLPEVSGADGADRTDRERAARHSDAAVASVLDRLHATGPLDLVYERYALWGRTATAWAQEKGVRAVLEVNAPLVAEASRHRGLVDIAGAERVASDAIGRADAVVCVTDPVADWARDRTHAPERVHTVANGVDTRAITPAGRPVTAADATTFTVGFVGTLKPWHGVDVLIDALALLLRRDPSYRLLLVGHGPQAQALADRAGHLGIDRAIEATGAVDAAEMPALLHRMDVATAPYPELADFYFSPLKVYEYLAAGLPVVASRIGGLPALLGDGRLGTLVDPGDARALADAIADLRADATRRADLGRLGPENMAANDWSRVVERILDLVGIHLDVSADDLV